jgi:hypothetical protein
MFDETEETPDSTSFIYQLTMNTLVNQDVLRKIQYKNVSLMNGNEVLCFKEQVSDWIRILSQDSSQEKKEIPEEIQKTYDIFIKNCYFHWKKKLEKRDTEKEQTEDQKSIEKIMDEFPHFIKNHMDQKMVLQKEEDSKEISLLPIFMKYQHPVWNNSRFNKKKGNYIHPHLTQQRNISSDISYPNITGTLSKQSKNENEELFVSSYENS